MRGLKSECRRLYDSDVDVGLGALQDRSNRDGEGTHTQQMRFSCPEIPQSSPPAVL